MAEIDVLRTVAAVVFLFFVPGFFLWKALVPRPKDIADEFAAVYTVAFSMALSIAAVILTGIVLGALPLDPVTGRGRIVDWNFPALLVLSAAAAGGAWYRGAFPQLGRLSPALKRLPKPSPDGSGVSDDPKRYWQEQELMARRQVIRAQLKRGARAQVVAGKDKPYLATRKAQLTEELVQVDDELQRLRDEREIAIEKAEGEAERLEERRRARRDSVLTLFRLKRAGATTAAGAPAEAAEAPQKEPESGEK